MNYYTNLHDIGNVLVRNVTVNHGKNNKLLSWSSPCCYYELTIGGDDDR